MFEVIEKKTGKKVMVYGLRGDEFLVRNEERNCFEFQDMIFYKPVPENSPQVISQKVPCVFSFTVRQDEDDLNELLYRMEIGDQSVKLGDMISFKLLDETDVDMVVTDYDDSMIRLESRDCLEFTTSAQTLDSYLDRIEALMPSALLDRAIVVERPHVDAKGRRYTEKRQLFVPAASEIFPPDECYGDKGLYQQLEWYKDVRNRIRKRGRDGDVHWYWTGSPYSSNSNGFCYVSSSGNASCYSANGAYGLAPFGCIISKI